MHASPRSLGDDIEMLRTLPYGMKAAFALLFVICLVFTCRMICSLAGLFPFRIPFTGLRLRSISSWKAAHAISKEGKELVLKSLDPLRKDDERTVRIQTIVDRLTSASKCFKYKVRILIEESPIAFTVGGDHVFITTGYLRLCRTDSDVACILAREVAHHTAYHKPAWLVGPIPYPASALMLPWVKSAIGSKIYLMVLGVDRELEADRIAVFYSAQAQFDPEGLIHVLGRLNTLVEEGRLPISGRLQIPLTRLPLKTRIERLELEVPRALKRFPPVAKAQTTDNTRYRLDDIDAVEYSGYECLRPADMRARDAVLRDRKISDFIAWRERIDGDVFIRLPLSSGREWMQNRMEAARRERPWRAELQIGPDARTLDWI